MKTHWITVVIAATGLISCGPRADSFTFRFAPALDKPIIKTLKTQKRTLYGANSLAENQETRTRLTATKSDDGYLLAYEPLSSSLTRDGKPVEDKILKTISDTTITYSVDKNGKLQSVAGFEDILNRLKEVTDEATLAQLEKVIASDLLSEKVKDDWTGRYEDFVGKTAAVGDVWGLTRTITLPDGRTSTYYRAVSFTWREACAESSCIRVQEYYNSNLDELATTLTELDLPMPENWPALPEGEEPGVATVTGDAERLINPSTMRIYSESQQLATILQFESKESGKIPVVIEVSNQDIYDDYSPEPAEETEGE